uniref:EGF-like domain-containing protein n=1 Tax=Ditylenchus dipsaci TaxID=166011 RepID=A0A915CQE0_9BILA
MQSMILRQAMTSPPSLLVFLAIVISLSSCLQPVHAGFAFLANQAHCKLTCLNGGVCAFDTQQTNIHKCICFIGLFEGEQCQIQVTNEPSPSPNHQKDEEEEDEEEDIDEMDEEGEEHQALEDQQPEKVEQQHQEHSPPEQKQQEELEDKVEEEPYHQEVHEFAEANADEYETELSVVEPEEEDKQEVEVVTTETTQHTQSIDSSGSEEKFIEEVTPKQALPNIHLGDSSNFVDLPNNPRGIKHYENTRTRTPHSEDPVATAWEYRPRKGAAGEHKTTQHHRHLLRSLRKGSREERKSLSKSRRRRN